MTNKFTKVSPSPTILNYSPLTKTEKAIINKLFNNKKNKRTNNFIFTELDRIYFKSSLITFLLVTTALTILFKLNINSILSFGIGYLLGMVLFLLIVTRKKW